MNKKQALDILKISSFKDFGDIELDYRAEYDKAYKAHNNAINDAVREIYNKRINDLNEAYNYLNEHKDELHKKDAVGGVLDMVPGKGWMKYGVIAGVLLIGVIAFLGIRSVLAEKSFEEAMAYYESAKIEHNEDYYKKALESFQQSASYGSVNGLFYSGLVMRRLGQTEEGLVVMSKAVQKDPEEIDADQLSMFLDMQSRLKSK